ncbi:hypothetical protein K2173_020850 [Erythroxylum novogranatense]|uniref:Surfeit locus protein 2 n=1 Tax=Erythroxylum novogranatense TaxID=1862640 RepID=A0AAV8TPK7_9ROSI|nr:hypothetical protein K2173_020850 [Erythroxylum novogranatense]
MANAKKEKEGNNLLGSATFTELKNGRFKCVETGHELLAKDMDSYSQSKRCRLGLIDFALANKNPPLNMFKQDPLSRSKLICKLTGDTVNKSEEHIWKHLNGRQFLNKLEQEEAGKLSNGKPVEKVAGKQNGGLNSDMDCDKRTKKKKKKSKNAKEMEEIISEVRNASDKDSDTDEADFWITPVGNRWDFDNGGDRWGSGGESEQESEKENGADDAIEASGKESKELSKRTKRMPVEVGPDSFASRKKRIQIAINCIFYQLLLQMRGDMTRMNALC